MGAGDQQTPAASGAKPTSTPTIYVKLVKADGLREHLGKPPTASMLLRVSVGGHAQEQVLRSKGVSASHSPQWDQEFTLKVPDPYQSQLECTIWDESDVKAKNYSNFLGEVLLNLAKLVKFRGKFIEQMFYIKQGKTIETPQTATGTLKLGLRLDMGDDWPLDGPPAVVAPKETPKESPREAPEETAKRVTKAAAPQAVRAAAPPPPPAEKESPRPPAQESTSKVGEGPPAQESTSKVEEALRKQREEEEKAAVLKAEKEKAEAEARAKKAEAEKEAAQKELKEQKERQREKEQDLERERQRQEAALSAAAEKAQHEAEAAKDAAARAEREAMESLKKAQADADKREEASSELERRRAQEGEMARKAAELMKKVEPPRTPQRLSMEPRNRNDARVVIAVIEAQQLSPAAYDCNPQARLTVQGASTVSEAETKKLSQTKDPFWNEKFVFGIDEENMDDLNIVAQINSDGRVVGTVADIPVKTLLNGQRMSLPTVNQGREIYCVDGWFEVFPDGNPDRINQPVVSTTRSPGKAQIHLRMTYIPGSTAAEPVSPSAPRVLSPQSTPVMRQAPPPPPAAVRASPVRSPAPPAPSGFSDVGLILGGGGNGAPLQVQGMVQGMPAQESCQIQEGDALLDVDGYDVVGRDAPAVDALLRGEEGTPVTLIFQRSGRGGDPVVVTLIRVPAGSRTEREVKRSPPPVQQRAVASAPPTPSGLNSAAPRTSPFKPAEPEVATAVEGPAALRQEFKSIAFLWGEDDKRDPIIPVLTEWKDDLLYGPPMSTQPLPPPPQAYSPSQPVSRDVPILPPQQRSMSLGGLSPPTHTSRTVTYTANMSPVRSTGPMSGSSPLRSAGPPLSGSMPQTRSSQPEGWSSAFA